MATRTWMTKWEGHVIRVETGEDAWGTTTARALFDDEEFASEKANAWTGSFAGPFSEKLPIRGAPPHCPSEKCDAPLTPAAQFCPRCGSSLPSDAEREATIVIEIETGMFKHRVRIGVNGDWLLDEQR